jgi:hypothetical protein
MLNKRVGSLALVLITMAAAGLYGCGSDDDTVASGGSGGGGASGGAGKGGGGSGGKAGTAGTAGTAGGSEAGAAGSSAGAPAEEGGMGGAAPGAAGSGATAGEAEGGSGGEAGGGAVALTLAQACTVMCSDQTSLSCTFGSSCMDTCTGNEGMTPFPEEYDAMVGCEAQHLTPSNYECSNQGGTNIWPAPKVGTTCETLICKWTCDDATICDANIYDRCGCM